MVEIEGTTGQGEYAPIVIPERVRVIGTAPLPDAKPTSFERLASGVEDSQFVEVVGIVRAVAFDRPSQHFAIALAVGGGRLTAFARQLPVAQPGDLVDTTLRVRGVCSTQFNQQRQLFALRLMVPRPEDLRIETASAPDPQSMPVRSIGSLLQFTPQGTYGHRVKVSGTVVFHQPGKMLYIQDEKNALQIQSKELTPLQVGDQVEVRGFVAQGQYSPVLEDAVYRKTGVGPMPLPVVVGIDEALTGKYDGRLVRVMANLVDRAGQSREQFLVLEAEGFIFHAHIASTNGMQPFSQIENGSKVAVTGVCLIEPGEWKAGKDWRAKSFRLLLRTPSDVVVLSAPPWWTLQKLLWMSGILFVVIVAALVWVWVLRRRVRKQTAIIRQQLVVEADLKERYQDLFENANDMVFTHDPHGVITSINKAGERLFQLDRADIISKNLADFMPDDQKVAALKWLEQVAQGEDIQTAEWDFVNAAGQRIKLEISSRLIEQDGRAIEIEGVGRDITERRHLERELLEVSNREQRRIGHDLHDGVCQQLAAIAYLVDIMGDKLQEKKAPESADAEKIETLINEATQQARAVARGLFPVRLEENGLVSALQELAATIASRFTIRCDFKSAHPPDSVDNETALHLYYIAQEAGFNAARHGKARTVVIGLEPEGDQCKLSVKDDGSGFNLGAGNRLGMGIRIMRYRAKVIGATLDLQSQPGRGTLVTCIFNPTVHEARAVKTNDRSS